MKKGSQYSQLPFECFHVLLTVRVFGFCASVLFTAEISIIPSEFMLDLISILGIPRAFGEIPVISTVMRLTLAYGHMLWHTLNKILCKLSAQVVTITVFVVKGIACCGATRG